MWVMPSPVAAEGGSISFTRKAGLAKLPAFELAKGRQTELRTDENLTQEAREEKLRVDIGAYTTSRVSTQLCTCTVFHDHLGSAETNGNLTYCTASQAFQCNGQYRTSTCFHRTAFNKHTRSSNITYHQRLAQQLKTFTVLLISNLPIRYSFLRLKFWESFANLAVQQPALQLLFKLSHCFTLQF